MAHELTHVAEPRRAGDDARRRSSRRSPPTSSSSASSSAAARYGDDDDNPSFLVLFLVSIAVYVISFFLMQALSRYREFAADRGSAIITGRPSALASALMKISGGMERIPQQDLRASSELSGVLHLPGRRRQGASAACSPRTRRWRSGSRRCSASRRSSRARA